MRNAYEGRRQAPPLPTANESASPIVGVGASRETGVRGTMKAGLPPLRRHSQILSGRAFSPVLLTFCLALVFLLAACTAPFGGGTTGGSTRQTQQTQQVQPAQSGQSASPGQQPQYQSTSSTSGSTSSVSSADQQVQQLLRSMDNAQKNANGVNTSQDNPQQP